MTTATLSIAQRTSFSLLRKNLRAIAREGRDSSAVLETWLQCLNEAFCGSGESGHAGIICVQDGRQKAWGCLDGGGTEHFLVFPGLGRYLKPVLASECNAPYLPAHHVQVKLKDCLRCGHDYAWQCALPFALPGDGRLWLLYCFPSIPGPGFWRRLESLSGFLARRHGELIQEENRMAAGQAKAREEAVAMLIHELKSPLVSMIHELDMERTDHQPAQGTLAGRVKGMQALIHAYLDYLRVGHPPNVPVSFDELRDELAHEFDRSLLRLGIDWECRVGEGHCVRGHKILLYRALANIMENSVKALGNSEVRPRQVVWEASIEGGFLILDTWDSGPGIPFDLRARLFAPFARGREGGHGLGLAYCKRILESHGGRILYLGKPQASRFRLELPIFMDETDRRLVWRH